MIELPGGDVVNFAHRFHVAAIFIVSIKGHDGPPVMIGTAVDIRRSVMVNTSRVFTATFKPGADIGWAKWCDAAAARRIVQAVTHRGGNAGLVTLDLPAAVASIESTARWYGTGLSPHDHMMERIGARVEHIATKVEASRQTGGLGFVAKEYHRRRLAAQAAGKRYPPWGTIEHRLKRVLGEHAAAQSTGAIGPDILARVFGSD
jgi:hypothetical protein